MRHRPITLHGRRIRIARRRSPRQRPIGPIQKFITQRLTIRQLRARIIRIRRPLKPLHKLSGRIRRRTLPLTPHLVRPTPLLLSLKSRLCNRSRNACSYDTHD